MAQPGQYTYGETPPSLFDEDSVTFRMSRGDGKHESYGDFIKKFEQRRTTDDCMTPPAVYAAVLKWTCGRCGIGPARTRIIRPFRPGGDHLAEDHSGDCVVIDNPPFSILAEIMGNCLRMGVRFLPFAPHLTLFAPRPPVTRTVTNSTVTCDNGAKVNTGFVSDMFGDVAVMTAPDLARAVKNAARDGAKKSIPKHACPGEPVTSARLGRCARFIDFSLTLDEVFKVSSPDSMGKKSVYGGGFLISEERAAELRAAELRAAELRAAELRAAHRWELSDREKEIIKKLGKQS